MRCGSRRPGRAASSWRAWRSPPWACPGRRARSSGRSSGATSSTAPAAPPPIPGAAAAGGAQDGPTTTHINALLSQLPPPPPDEDLPIGPGDLIEISVFEVEELSKIKVRIPMRGTITLPLIGPTPAAVHSALELQDEISQRLAEKYMSKEKAMMEAQGIPFVYEME